MGHQGIVKTKELLRSKVWFPGINQKVEALIKRCNECQVNQAKQQFEPLMPSVFPNEPWEELSSDFFGPMSDSSYWLVVSDDYSRYPVVKRVCSTSAEVNIPVLEEMFSTFGIPRVFKTDNGPPFQSHKFKEFAERMNFYHRRVTPYWPRSNGEAERFMQNLKKVLKNAQVNGTHKEQELQFFLRAYRATPHCVTKVPPSVLLFGFSKTSGIPSVAKRSNEPIHIFARENDNRAKQMMKINYDRVKHVSECPITIGSRVFLKIEKITKSTSDWDPETFEVIEINKSMITAKRNNKTVTRNSSFFKRAFHPMDEIDYRQLGYTKVAMPTASSQVQSYSTAVSSPSVALNEALTTTVENLNHKTLIIPTIITTRSGRVSVPPDRLGIEQQRQNKKK